ncbi:pyridoxal phosphate-dependent decarboxylase family protein [Paenibacillus tarimensis]|uniref:pyridoxal phosphate-dependent decarboxylase family protein n=1 Tax=Paenibacillus tarimensis TaxID=416012 RepID=UPI001F430A60|nr:pyridoxal-dependent decarboxylase [Paenibacillus tarimensis]MCF2943920.1 pyridoxal-dependent decarboxylase [Paenibacillus tarimensis]
MDRESITDIRQLFPSDDGSAERRHVMLGLFEQLLKGTDALKDPDAVYLKGSKDRSESFYNDILKTSSVPVQGMELEEVGDKLLHLLHAHPYHTKYFLTNILPMASIPGIVGMLAAFMVNGNNLWDVYGPAGAEAEVNVIAMMSRVAGYDPLVSGGYTTWGGQGAIFTGLRMAIAKFAPEAKRSGVPGNLYAFCSEAAHYSLYKSMEATGLGSDRLVRVRTLPDSSMDIADLKRKLEQVIHKGGIPVYIVATTSTTDAMGIDDVSCVYATAQEVAAAHGLQRPHIHADSALGGFFAFFNDYDFAANPLAFSAPVLEALEAIRSRMIHLGLADSLCFDFQKLGQTPYTTSLFLVKNAQDLNLIDLEPEETPYVGHRGYGQYHTGYTLECSRMASSISIYSALLAFGADGYRRLLAQFVEVNLAFRAELALRAPELVIVNPANPGIITLFRIYPKDVPGFSEEVAGECTLEQITRTNEMNERLFEALGEGRDRMFFGDTKKHLVVETKDGNQTALYASKLFVISPYTQVEHVGEIVTYLKQAAATVIAEYEAQSMKEGLVPLEA